MKAVVSRRRPPRRRADRGVRRGARRDRRRARPDPGALHRRPPRRRRGPPGRAGARGATCAPGYDLDGRARRAVRRPRCARTRTRSCSSRARRCSATARCVVLAGHPEPYDARAARARRASWAWQDRVRFAGLRPDDADLEALWRARRRAPRSRPAPRASGCRCWRRCRAACRWRARDIPVLREVAGGLARTSRPTIPQGAADADHRGAARRRRGAAAAAWARALHVAGGRARHLGGVRARCDHVGLNLVFLVPGQTGGMEVYARELTRRAARRATACASPRSSTARRRPEDSRRGATVVVPRRRHAAASSGCAASSSYLPRARATGRAATSCTRSPPRRPVRGRFARVTTIHDLNYKLVPDAHFGLRGLGMRVLVPAAARRSHRDRRRLGVDPRRPRRAPRVAPEKIDVVPLGRGRRPRAGHAASASCASGSALGDRPRRAQRQRQAPAQEPRAAARRARRDPRRAAAGAGRARATRRPRGGAARARRGAGRGGRRALGRPGCPTPTSRACTRSPRCVVVPLALRGLRAAGAGGHAARGARRVLGPRLAARGRRRRRAALRPRPTRPRSRAALERLLGDDGAARPACASAGRAQAAAFSWERTAELTAAVYERALSERP